MVLQIDVLTGRIGGNQDLQQLLRIDIEPGPSTARGSYRPCPRERSNTAIGVLITQECPQLTLQVPLGVDGAVKINRRVGSHLAWAFPGLEQKCWRKKASSVWMRRSWQWWFASAIFPMASSRAKSLWLASTVCRRAAEVWASSRVSNSSSERSVLSLSQSAPLEGAGKSFDGTEQTFLQIGGHQPVSIALAFAGRLLHQALLPLLGI